MTLLFITLLFDSFMVILPVVAVDKTPAEKTH